MVRDIVFKLGRRDAFAVEMVAHLRGKNDHGLHFEIGVDDAKSLSKAGK
jgi:hypothetical protein